MTKVFKRASLYLFAFLVVALATLPFYWAIVSSLKTGSDLFKVEFFPSNPAFQNYLSIFKEQPFGQNIFNSLIVAVGVVGFSLVLSTTAAYALGRIQFKGRTTLLLLILAVSMFPQVAILSGMFELIRALNLYNNLLGLMLGYTTFILPFTIWMLTTFMKQIPREIEEAAIIDGASTWIICTRILLPLMGPALITTSLLSFIAAWNEFLFALTFTLNNSARTVPVAIALMTGATEHELPWGNIMAASVVVTVPLILLVLFFQRRIVSGLTAGAIKG